MKIDATTKLADLLAAHPELKTGLASINGKFRMLQTPVGKKMMKKATVADMSERSGMPIDKLVAAIEELMALEAMPSNATEPAPAPATADAPAADGDALPSWWDKTPGFKTLDVRGAQGNFLPGLKKQAAQVEVGSGLEVVQSFEPIPLYDVMAELGFERVTRRDDEGAYHVFFHRTEEGAESGEIAFRPIALLNFPLIDEDLADVAVNFWDLTWNDERRFLPQETRLLLSMANAIGAGRMRQATRELIKAYALGTDSAALDDVFELVAWNQGIGTFASEIGPSTLFAAYRTIKQMEKRDAERGQIVAKLKEEFGEKNPDVGVR